MRKTVLCALRLSLKHSMLTRDAKRSSEILTQTGLSREVRLLLEWSLYLKDRPDNRRTAACTLSIRL